MRGGGLPFGPASYSMLGYFGAPVPPTVRQGSRGDVVKTLQQRLNALGFNVGTADGAFGPRTTLAVRAFQKSKGLPQDGVVGPNTWRALGIGPVSTPAPKAATPKVPAKAVAPPPAKTAATTTLQNAVRSLAQKKNDPTLLIKADGVMGPKTAAAVNRALTRYATTAPASLRTGKLSTSEISTNWSPIAQALEQAAKAPSSKTATATPKAALASKAAVQRLQTALRNLGVSTNNAALKIAVDGILGPRTVAAVNAATGRKFTQAEVQANIAALTTQIEKAKAPKSTATTASKAAAVQTPPRIVIARLQRALIDLGNVMGDSTLKALKADGLTGPKTAAALNRALEKYVRNKPASMSHKFTPAQVTVMAEALVSQLESELAKRRSEAAKAPATPSAQEDEAVPTIPGMEEEEAAVLPFPEPQAVPPPQQRPQAPSPQQQAQTFQPEQEAFQPSAESFQPEAPSSQYQPPDSSPSVYQPPGMPETAPEETAALAPAEKKPLPWKWIIGGGVGVLLIGGLTIFAFSKRNQRKRR